MPTRHLSRLLATTIATALIPFAASAAPADPLTPDISSARAAGAAEPVREIIVTYHPGTPEHTSSAAALAGIHRALARTGLSAQALGGGSASYLRRLATGGDLIRLSGTVDRVVANAILRQIAADANVQSVEIDEIMYFDDGLFQAAPQADAAPTFTPNDPRYATHQWHLHTPDGNTDGNSPHPNYGGANLPDAWELSTGEGIVIAILDTGITAHPDLDTSLADSGYDFLSSAFRSGRAQDGRAPGGWDLGDWTVDYPGVPEGCNPNRNSSWHGTHVAGTAGAAITGNATGPAGVAHGAKILPVRVLGHCGGPTSDVAEGIIWAAGGSVPGVPDNPNPAHVINLSLGGYSACSSTYANAIAQATERGAVVVASAGNGNREASEHRPSNCPGAISVAANGITSARAGYSNFGAVDIAAPGGGGSADGNPGGYVWQVKNPGTTVPAPVVNPNSSSGSSGTSQAAPHVSGIVALMQSARLNAGLPLLTPDEVLSQLQETATAFTIAPDPAKPIGPGIVNAAAAVERALACADCDPPPAAEPITNRIPITGLAGVAGSERLFALQVPANVRSALNILTNGGSGDVALYVRFGEPPTADVFDGRSARRGNDEAVRIRQPQPGTWYILLRGEPGAYQGITLRALHNIVR